MTYGRPNFGIKTGTIKGVGEAVEGVKPGTLGDGGANLDEAPGF